ncbi:MAG: glycosyltransferase, partial [Candidatus Limnocylindrales bacterium]
PDDARRRIAAFLGVSAPAGSDVAEPPATELYHPWEHWKSRSTDSITDERVRAWERTLSPRQSALVASICHVGMRAFGYGAEAPAPLVAAMSLCVLPPRRQVTRLRRRRGGERTQRSLDQTEIVGTLDAGAHPLTIFAMKADSGNPYAKILYDEVRGRGATVIEVAEWRTPELLRRTAKGARILHLQWGGGSMFAGPSALRASARLCRYLLSLAALRLRGIRIVWTFHDDEIGWSRHTRLARIFQYLLIRFVANRTVVLRPGVCELVRQRCGSQAERRVHVVPHPTYERIYGPAPTGSEARRRFGLPLDARVLLYFGLIRPYKGVPELLEAFSTLPGPELTLVVAGRPASPDLRRDIERAAAKDTRVALRLARVPDEDVAALMSAADVVVLPYRNGLNSGVLHLAVTYDRPVVAPRLGPFAELAAVGELPGLVYDPGGLAGAIAAAVDASPEERERWSRAMERHRAAGRPGTVADALMRCYREATT